MALGLNAKCQSRVKQLLAEHLADVKVNNDVFLHFRSTLGLTLANEALPKTGQIYEKLQKYVSEIPLFHFVYETLSSELYESGSYKSENSQISLQTYAGYEDLEAVARRLVDEFESLPQSYLVSLELPHTVGGPIRSATSNVFALSSALRIVSPDEQYDSQYPLQSGIKQRDEQLFGRPTLLTSYEPKQWDRETSYLQINTDGFIGRYGTGAPLEEAIWSLKSFIGLSLATRLMKIKEGQEAWPFGVAPTMRLIVHRQSGDSWEMWSTHELPSDLSATLNRLEIHDLGGRVTADKVSGWIQNRLPVVSTAFQDPNKAERVLLAAQWLLDGYVGVNELLSFVQTTVAMEIMLGEESKSDVIGIGEMLRNRCAYLIGKSHSQRKEILEDFERIYGVRSKIVHRGKSRLSYGERALFSKLQWMCRRVISEELDLIAKDKKETGVNVSLLTKLLVHE